MPAMAQLLEQRILLATQQSAPGSVLRDPIENDPSTAPKVKEAAAEAQQLALKMGRVGRGSCHYLWEQQARILIERHGIAWFSPLSMNPGMKFD
ncbi:hypothetical protein SAMN05428972_1577 [Rhodanobacter sp. OK091]|jgi:hypothetical protein|nr:hypothetical protein SAMN05428972_1577 [Rhodanobacter sp. OK091]